jgi:FtsZ-binding cell division protein ZapB
MLVDQLLDANNKISSLKRENADLYNQITKLRDEIEELQCTNDRLRENQLTGDRIAAVARLCGEVDSLKAEVQKLRGRRSSLSDRVSESLTRQDETL